MAKKPLTAAEKYRQLKAQTERAGMKVEEVDSTPRVSATCRKKHVSL